MANNKLSDLEINLINATRKFVNNINNGLENEEHKYIMTIKYNGKESFINIEFPLTGVYHPALASLKYSNNSKFKGKIIITRNLDYKASSIPSQYKEALTQEIPEIKDRLIIV